MKPEYDVWAEMILQEIYHTPENLRANFIKEQLLKAVRRGYTDGLDNGWAHEQEKDIQKRAEVARLQYAMGICPESAQQYWVNRTVEDKCGEVKE